jgi:hypothetical protein
MPEPIATTPTRNAASASRRPTMASVGVIPMQHTNAWILSAAQRIRELSALRQGWDGENGPSVTDQALASAGSLLEQLAKPRIGFAPHVGPVVGGGLQLEWTVGVKSLEIEVLPDGRFEFLAARGNEMQEGEIHDLFAVQSLVSWLLSDE